MKKINYLLNIKIFFYNGEILLKNKEEKAKYYTWNLDFFQATYCVAKFDVFFYWQSFSL